MRIKNLQSEIVMKDGFVYLYFKMEPAEFLKMTQALKEQPKKKKEQSAPVDLKDKKDKLYTLIRNWQLAHPGKYPSGMYEEFIRYWGEASKDGKAIRYDKEKFFDIGRRLATSWGRIGPEEKSKLWERNTTADLKLI